MDENYNNRIKYKETSLKKYGYENPMQSSVISAKTKKKYKYNNIYFDSNWELIIYKALIKNNIDFEYHPNITFEYKDSLNNTTHYYQPDFLINDDYYEIKGPQFFDSITGKMINPYGRKQLTKTELEASDSLYESKHQCMLKNGVCIITELNKLFDLLNIEVNYE